MSKLTIEQVKDKLSKTKIIIISDYINSSTKTKFRCYCGKIFETFPTKIFTGKTKSCGCYNLKCLTSRFIDLSDKKFGRLLVLRRVITQSGKRIKFLCKCDCGKLKEVASNNLTANKTLSCGCLVKEKSRINILKFRHLQVGNKNPNYNHQLTDKHRSKRRVGIKLITWRTSVFKRDNYTCQICNKRGNKLNAHHKDGWSWSKERRFDINNGVTLCRLCHVNFHSQYGIKNNTEAQFKEFSNAYN